MELYCPVCETKVEWFDICENCNWQNSGPKENENDPCGPNKISLKEARKVYLKDKNIK